MLHFGIGVSRDKLDCAVVDEQGPRVKGGRTLKNDAQSIIELAHWARQIAVEQPLSIAIEAAAYYELAAVVVKKINLDVKDLYERLCAQGKTKMSALGACMRKLVHLCYGVLRSGRDYVGPELRLRG
jgi:hypothetical protein